MRILRRLSQVGLLSATLLVPIAISPVELRTDDDDHRRETKNRRYHDSKYNDDHEWNEREDRAYRMWTEENHRKYRDFAKLNERDRDAYWGWRHDHSDAQLKIDIR